jgi:mannose-6-phosphate isomerase-like protein (cupin superfamily)
MIQYKLIRTSDLLAAPNPQPGERVRMPVLQENTEQAHLLNGIFGCIPPATPGSGPQYHYHVKRESIIHLLAGDATEMIDGKAVALKPGDIIYIAPGVKHSLVNNSATAEVKFIEFYAPAAPDMVRIDD